jgi:hypothetical protein
MEQMSPNSFQNVLRSRHIIIENTGLANVPCNRRGLMSLNGLKEVVKKEAYKFYAMVCNH